MVQQDELIGTWLLESWFESDNCGNKFCPLGSDISGFLTYTKDNYTVVISGIEPRHFRALANRQCHDHKHRTDVFSKVLSHQGDYTFSHHELIYRIKGSNHHHWKGSHHKRYFKLLPNNRLQTSTPPFIKDGVKYVSNFVWRREQ